MYSTLRDACWIDGKWVPRSEFQILTRGSSEAERRAHTAKAAGSNPAPATNPRLEFNRLLNMGAE